MEMSGSFSRGRVSYEHDVRITKTKSVDEKRTCDNLVIEDNIGEFVKQGMSQKKAIEAYINQEMQPFIDEYNAKQKREDRKIKVPYCEYWKTNDKINQGKMMYEFVGQIGEHETNGRGYYEATGEEKERQVKIYRATYKKCVDEFKKKYPHMKVLWATVHLDEPGGTPHFHICCVPIGEGYKQGLSHQVSIGNALACDGIERAKTRLEGFQMTRMYDDILTNVIKPKIEKLFPTAKIKEVIHGRLHKTKSEWEEEKKVLEGYVKAFYAQNKRQEALEHRIASPVLKERVFGASNKAKEGISELLENFEMKDKKNLAKALEKRESELAKAKEEIEKIESEELVDDDDFELG